MQKTEGHPLFKKAAVKAVAIFLVSYLVFFALWIPIKGFYGYTVTYIASEIVMLIKDVRIEDMARENDIVQPAFTHFRHNNMIVDIPVKISSYAFNVPLTLALMAALFEFIKKREKAYAEALLMLFSAHLLYIFALEAKQLTDVFTDRGLEKVSGACMFAYQFLWTFTDNMIIRFEPFLVGFYLYARFRSEAFNNTCASRNIL